MTPHRLGATLSALALWAAAGAGCTVVTPFGTPVSILTDGPTYVVGRGSESFASSAAFLAETREALDEVGIRSIHEQPADGAVFFEGRTASNRRAVVSVRPEGARTQVKARFGPLGDDALTRAFFDRMGARLGRLDDQPDARRSTTAGLPAPLRANSAEAPPGTNFQRRLEGGYREMPSP